MAKHGVPRLRRLHANQRIHRQPPKNHGVSTGKLRLLALMCAEALPWRCHRSLISDALVVRHIKVLHIISATSTITHELTEFAHVEGTKITYPLFQ